MTDVIIAAIIGLGGVVFTSIFGVYMLNQGVKKERKEVIAIKKVEIYTELSSRLDSFNKSISIFTYLRVSNMSKGYEIDELKTHLKIYDKFASEFYEYYKEKSGIIKLFCTDKIKVKIENLFEDIQETRDKYQNVLTGDWYGRTPEEYNIEILKQLYSADAELRSIFNPKITEKVDEIICNLKKDANIY